MITTTPGGGRRGDTPPPRTGGSEAEVLRGFLDYLRESVSAKVRGLPDRRSAPRKCRPARICSACSTT